LACQKRDELRYVSAEGLVAFGMRAEGRIEVYRMRTALSGP
jgi:hypothetical protein